MNKLKNVFQRSSQKMKTIEDNRRPQQFVKRHSINSMVVPIHTSNEAPLPLPPPAINLADLSEMEKPAYQSWWKDLDPFDLQKINNQTILKFLNGCNLADNKLEQILALFETAGDGLNKLQFFAMLRLIAHAQNGRKISQALVYLGAPIPQFHTNAIDALIKSDIIPQRIIINNSPPKEDDILEDESATVQLSNNANQRKSWWGNEKEQLMDNNNRRSYMGPFTAHTPIPNSPFNGNNNNTNLLMMDYFYPNDNTSTTVNTRNNNATTPTPFNTFSPNIINHQQQQLPWSPSEDSNNSTPNNILMISTSMMRPILTSSVTATATITPVTPNIIQREEKYTHSRSRSAGTASDFVQSLHNPYQQPTEQQELQSSRSSLSLYELNTGQSLLLTQKFVYQSPSVRHQEVISNNHSNPFYIVSNSSNTPPPEKEVIVSPFDDENSDDNNDVIESIIQQESLPFHQQHINYKPNSLSIPPPPVPSQSSKPAFPKYTRTNTFLIKRSLSTAAPNHHININKHQRHKSTSATENIFY